VQQFFRKWYRFFYTKVARFLRLGGKGALYVSLALMLLVLSIQSIPALAQTSTSVLTVASQYPTGQAMTGLYVALSQGGQTVATGFTPAQFSLVQGQQYTVTVSDYRNYVFDRWQDSGSTVRARTISITQNTAIVALYRQPDLVLTPTSGMPGTTVTATGSYFLANSAVSITFDGAAVATNPSTVTSTNTGSFSATFAVPSSAPGSRVVQASAGFTRDTAAFVVGAGDTTPPTVTASPRGGTYSSAQSVTLAANEPATIYYTTDGTNPPTSSTRSTYSSPIAIVSSTTLRFYGVDLAGNAGSVTNENYVIQTSQATVHMQDTTATGSAPTYASRRVNAEYVTSSSQLVGDTIDSITMRLQRIGSPTGTAQVGVFDSNQNVRKLFGTVNVAGLAASYQDYEFKLASGDSYTIRSGDRIGIRYTGGSSANAVNVATDTDAADPFDGAGSYRMWHQFIWFSATSEDLYMILRQAGASLPPPASISLNPASGPAGMTVIVTGSNFTPSSAVTISYNSAPVATSPVTVTTSSSGSFTASFAVPASSSPGQNTVRATDAASRTAAATFTHVNSSNQPPVANNRSAATTENTPVSIVLTGSDPEGQPVRFHIASPPAKGFLGMINPATGTVTYTPYDYRDGLDSFTYVASDGSLDSAPATVSISTANTAADSTSEGVVISIKTSNRSVTGLWTTLSQNGQTINSGGTHIAFDVNNNQQYVVTATDYGTNFFDHWQDTGSTSRSRTISIAKDTPLVAVYR
jgi:hypothetical protein